jgi:hypothetical protein
MSDATLFGYWRSSAAYRVRIACNLKGIVPEQQFVHLRKGEQRGAEHLARNPAGLLPVWPSSNISKKRIPNRNCFRVMLSAAP